MKDFHELLRVRRSTRKFTPEEISSEDVKTIMEAALMAQYDEILVLRDGRIQEQGTFSELMNRKEYFYSLFTLAQPA